MGGYCSWPKTSGGDVEVVADGDVAILVKSAKGLRRADSGGSSDPYCLCKVGPVGSSWKEKDDKTLRRSPVIVGETDPVWNFAMAYGKEVLAGAELQILVWDEDFLSDHDSLGRLQVPMAQLESHAGELRDYPLEGKQATGSVSLMIGPRVTEALLEQMKQGPPGDLKGDTVLWWWSLADSFNQYISRTAYYVRYYVEMLGFQAAGQLPGAVGLRSWFLRRSRNANGEDTYLWKGPFPEHCTTYSGHADVAEKLRKLGPRLGTSNGDGDSYRTNFLGFQLLNGVVWPEKPNHVIALGETQEAHAFFRPLIAKLVGPPPSGRWTPDQVRQMAADFWKGRNSVESGDLKPWTTQVLHKIHLDLNLTWEEAQDFTDFQTQVLLIIPFPDSALEAGSAQRDLLQVDKVLERKAAWLERYKAAMKVLLPDDVKTWSSEQLTLGASFIMDSLLFAGGASVPVVLSYCLSVPWTHWGKNNLPADFQLKKSTLYAYVLETVRRFPPVGGVHYRDRAFGGSKADQDVICNVMMAAFDPRVWKDHDKFVLRPPEDYAKNSLMWAEAAMAPENASPNSHACPAKDLSIRMVVEFLTAFLQVSLGSDARVQKDESLDLRSWDLSPALVIINEYGPLPSFTLKRKGG